MIQKTLQILPTGLLTSYIEHISDDALSAVDRLEDAEISTPNFSFYTSVASVYSSKIEGEQVELDSYVKHKRFGAEFMPDYTKKIDDLYDAYAFAQRHKLKRKHIEETHRLLSQHLVATHQQGKLRNQHMYVTTPDGKIEYVAATPFELEGAMEKYYDDLGVLVSQKLNRQEAFFFASLLHLGFVKIHPWIDGNGRNARLIEKWFLAQQLGEKAWLIPSERYYYQHHQTYYHNIQSLGLEYPNLDYTRALPFLLMLPQSLIATNETT